MGAPWCWLPTVWATCTRSTFCSSSHRPGRTSISMPLWHWVRPGGAWPRPCASWPQVRPCLAQHGGCWYQMAHSLSLYSGLLGHPHVSSLGSGPFLIQSCILFQTSLSKREYNTTKFTSPADDSCYLCRFLTTCTRSGITVGHRAHVYTHTAWSWLALLGLIQSSLEEPSPSLLPPSSLLHPHLHPREGRLGYSFLFVSYTSLCGSGEPLWATQRGSRCRFVWACLLGSWENHLLPCSSSVHLPFQDC